MPNHLISSVRHSAGARQICIALIACAATASLTVVASPSLLARNVNSRAQAINESPKDPVTGLYIFPTGQPISSREMNENFAHVQDSATSNGSGGAPGTDVWTQSMFQKGLFTPHESNCSSSEVFIPMVGGLGFCIEKSVREKVDYWIRARNTCLASGKRLPEINEHLYIAQYYGDSLSYSSQEFASNYSAPMFDSNLGHVVQGVPVFKNYSGERMYYQGASTSQTYFRCVR